MSGLVSKKDFAAIYGCSKAYVSQLVAAKRLVLSDDGRQVDVERSLELLGATADPSKAGVRERWAAYRIEHSTPRGEGAATAAALASPSAPPMAVAAPAAPGEPQVEQRTLLDDGQAPAAAPSAEPVPQARSEYQSARTLREQAEAEMAQIELLKARGQVLDVEPTLRAVVDAHMAVRGELLGLADRVAPLVAAETNPRRVWELINAEAERLCERMQRAAQQLGARARAEVTA